MAFFSFIMVFFHVSFAANCGHDILFKPGSLQWKECIEDEKGQIGVCRALKDACIFLTIDLPEIIGACTHCAKHCFAIGQNISNHMNMSFEAFDMAGHCRQSAQIHQVKFCRLWGKACDLDGSKCSSCAKKCNAEAVLLTTADDRADKAIKVADDCFRKSLNE